VLLTGRDVFLFFSFLLYPLEEGGVPDPLGEGGVPDPLGEGGVPDPLGEGGRGALQK